MKLLKYLVGFAIVVVVAGLIAGSVWAQSSCYDPYEPNENFDEAWHLTTPATIHSYLCEWPDTDYFSFWAEAGDPLYVSVYGMADSYWLRLYDPSQSLIASEGQWDGTPRVITATAGTTGLYYAHVYAFEGIYDTDHPAYTLSIDEAPDLVAPDVWLEPGLQQGVYIHAQVHNIGAAEAISGHVMALSIDGQPEITHTVEVTLPAGDRQSARLSSWSCSGQEDVVRVCADALDTVPEVDETNNCITETWVCDVAPPIITAGPEASPKSLSSAIITWTTNESSDSVVAYGRYAGVYESQVANVHTVTEHVSLLTDLQPGVAYHYVVSSTDAAGNSVTGAPGFFVLEALPGETPILGEPSVTKADDAQPRYRISVPVTDTANVARVEFYMDGELIGIDYTGEPSPGTLARAEGAAAPEKVNFEVTFDPRELDLSSDEFFNQPHLFITRGIGRGNQWSQRDFSFEPEREHYLRECNVDVKWPPPYYEVYVTGTVVPDGTLLPISVKSYYSEWGFTEFMGRLVGWRGLAKKMNAELYLEIPPSYLNPPPDDTSGPAIDHEFAWDLSGLSVNGGIEGSGVYRFKVRAVHPDDEDTNCWAHHANHGLSSQTWTVRILQGEPELTLTRSITRTGTAMLVTLMLDNAGTVPATVSRIRDNVQGFQPVLSATTFYEVESTDYNELNRYSDVEINLFSGSDDFIIIEPHHPVEITYVAVPILYPDLDAFNYGIGTWDDVVVCDGDGACRWEFDRPATMGSMAELLATAHASADYLIVTHPDHLFSQYGRGGGDVERLLAAMAGLAYRRNGILGYTTDRSEPRIRSQIRAWGEGMTGSDGIAGHFLSNGYLLLVGETEILPSWTVNTPDMDWSTGEKTTEVSYSDMPYADTIGGDDIPDLIVGRIIGDSPNALIRPLEASLAVADGAGFDRSFGIVTSGSEAEWEDFVLEADDVRSILDSQMTEGANAYHWGRWIHKEEDSMLGGFDFPFDVYDGFLSADVDGDGNQELVLVDESEDQALVYPYESLDRSTSVFTDTFDCRFTLYDGLASGDIDGDGVDEIIVGTDELDKLTVCNDTRSTSGSTFPEFDVEVDPWDLLAVGDVWGTSTEEILLATTDGGGMVYVYSYVTGGTYPELLQVDSFAIPFTIRDGFAVGNVSGAPGDKDEMIVASDNAASITIYDATGLQLLTIDAGQFTPYDGIATGDMDGDGMDEIATIIDDVIDGKRRFFIFEGNGDDHRLYSRSLDFDGVRTTANETRYDGFAIGDIHGDGEAEALVAWHRESKLFVLDGHYASGWKNRYMPWIQADSPSADVFTLIGHGSPVSCSPFDTGDISWFGLNAHPLGIALSCLTGNYEGDWWWYLANGTLEFNTDGDNGFAEAFFDSSAAVYIGATHVSSSNQNKEAGPAFFSGWAMDQTAGQAFHQYRRSRTNTGDDTWVYWATEYNYYGDPKFGAIGTTMAATRQTLAVSDPPPTLSVSIPMYEVTTIGNEDHVSIPGGEMLLEEGMPQVPYYIVEVPISSTYQVQDVTLETLFQRSITTGLNIPLAHLMPACASAVPTTAATAATGGAGWYPAQTFDWHVVSGVDRDFLLIKIYPFNYNPLTARSEFFRSYTFAIDYALSDVVITGLSAEEDVYLEGSVVSADLRLSHSGTLSQNVIVEAVVMRQGSDEVVEGLLLSALDGLTGTASFSPQWDSTGFAPGTYSIEANVRDDAGGLLDMASWRFRLGVSSGQTTLAATPTLFRIGDTISTSLTFSNTGTMPITGTVVIQVQDASGEVVEELRHGVLNLLPGYAAGFDDAWVTSGLERGDYTIVGYGLYDSQATDPAVVTVGTEVYVYLPLIVKEMP